MKFLRLLFILVVSLGLAVAAQQLYEGTRNESTAPRLELEVPGRIDTTSLGVYGFIIQGGAADDYLGYSVSAAGDVNGDGFADLLVGALKSDAGGKDAGEVYVIWGQANKQYGTLGRDGRRVVDTTNLGAAGFIIQGDMEEDFLSWSVSAAGDINGDGYADLIVGASHGDDGGEWAGEAYVIWGQADKQYGTLGSDGRRVVDTSSLGNAGFIIQGDAANDFLGISVSAAGDVNGDGFADLIVGAPYGKDGGKLAGEAYLIWGQANKAYGTLDSDGGRVLDTSRLGEAGFIIQGDAKYNRLGNSVSSAGDVNGDGYADILVGTRYGDERDTEGGEAYVIWGQASKQYGALDNLGRWVVDTFSLGDAGFIIRGDAAKDELGRSVSAAGDVNGDGYADLIVAAPFGDDGGENAGEAYVIWGQASKAYGTLGSDGRRIVNTTSLGDAGFIIQGDKKQDRFGWSVAAAGDANGDGYADLLVGALFGDDGGRSAEEAYLIWGQASKQYGTMGNDGRRIVDTSSLGDAGLIIKDNAGGDAAEDRLGHSVSAAGDVNGDGYSDLIVGAPLGDDGGEDAGEAYVIWGGAHLSGYRLGYDPDSANQPKREFDANVETTDYAFDFSDLFINANGKVVLSYSDTESVSGDDAKAGAATWNAAVLSIDLSAIDEDFDIIITATDNDNGDSALWRMAVAEKFPTVAAPIPDAQIGDKFSAPSDGADIAIDLMPVFGGGDGTLSYATTHGSISHGELTISPNTLSDGDNTISVTATDADGDAVIDDFVLTKSSLAVSGRIDTTILGVYGFVIQGDAANDFFGDSVSAAGDVNGDGYDDLIIGAVWGDDGGGNAGEAYVIWGQANNQYGTMGSDGRRVVDTTSLGDVGFIIQGDAGGDNLGGSVSAAGDVNGDGYDDLIVGAFGAEETYVIWGQADKAFGTLGRDGRRVIDTSSLGDAGFIIQGEGGDWFGTSVAAAGDVNGDGYADLIVGTYQYYFRGMHAGKVYVIWGQADKAYGTLGGDGRRVLDTTSLGDAGFIIQDYAVRTWLGYSVSAAGDVNGDGYTDLIAGAYPDEYVDDDAYVIWGQASKAYGTLRSDGRYVLDTTKLGDAGFIIRGNTRNDFFGYSVSAAGDVDGDGYADMIVGAQHGDGGDGGGEDAGEAYVIWGQADKAYGTLSRRGLRVVDTTTLGDAGFIIQGDTEQDNLGMSVSAAGDVNGDGYADLIVGARLGNDGGKDAGEAYVIWGQASRAYGTLGSDGRWFVDTSNLGDAGFIIQGDAAEDNLGTSVSAAGDVNGDGYDDLIVGALYGDDGGSDAGETYVIWGGAHLSQYRLGYDPDSANQPKRAFDANVETTDYSFDFSDLFIHANGALTLSYSDTESVSGDDNGSGATVGAATWDAAVLSIDISALDEDFDIFITATDSNGNSALWRMAVAEKNPAVVAPIPDAMAPAPVGGNFSSPSPDGADIVIDLMPVFGGGDGTLSYATSLGSISHGELTIAFSTLHPGDNTVTVTATDADGDAVIDDFVLTKSSLAVMGRIDTSSLGGHGFIIQGDAAGDFLGGSVSAAGDVNGDGYADLIVGAHNSAWGDDAGEDAGEDAGAAYVIWGQANKQYGTLGNDGRRVVDTTNLGDAGFIIQGDAKRDYLGRSVAAAGDVNGDGYADLIVGAYQGDDGGRVAGEAYVIWGQASKAYGTLGSDGRRVVDTTSLGGAGFIIQGDEKFDYLGVSVAAAGDVNGDGFADLIVGAYRGNGGGEDAGQAYVIWGQTDKQYGTLDRYGRHVLDTTNLGDAGFIIQGDTAEDRLGGSVSAAGDVNGDGYADLIVGAQLGDDGDRDAGETYVIWGQASKAYGTLDSDGRHVLDTTSLGDAGFIIQGDERQDRFGNSVSAAGDVNGDGYGDLIIGAYIGDDGDKNAGEAYVIWGQADKAYGTLGSDGRQVVDTSSLGDAGFIIQGDTEHDNLGYSVSAAGDVNGDGYADLIVGALQGDDGGKDAGEAYVIWGQAKAYGTLGSGGRRIVDTSSLGDAGFIIQGDAVDDKLGRSVSAAGDVDGDGYADLIVGAFAGYDGGKNAGEAYVIWGGAHLSGYRLGYDPDSANQPKRAFDANVETTDYAFDFSDLFINANGTVVLSYSDTESVNGNDNSSGGAAGAATWDASTEVLSIDLSEINEDFDIIITATDSNGNSALWRIDVLSTGGLAH